MKHVNMGSVGYDPTTNRCEQSKLKLYFKDVQYEENNDKNFESN